MCTLEHNNAPLIAPGSLVSTLHWCITVRINGYYACIALWVLKMVEKCYINKHHSSFNHFEREKKRKKRQREALFFPAQFCLFEACLLVQELVHFCFDCCTPGDFLVCNDVLTALIGSN